MNILSFHESTVTQFFIKKDVISICLEDVSTGNGNSKVKITVSGVTSILIDSEPLQSVEMPCSDGEILTLNINENKLFAVIEWNNFSTGDSLTRSYNILGASILVTDKIN